MFALVGDVLRQLGEEVEGVEDLVIARHPAEQVFGSGVGEAMGAVFLGVVHHLPGSGDAEQSGETERGAGHVLGESFESVAVAGGKSDGAINAEAAVSPGSDLADHGVIDAPGVEQQAEDVVLPDAAERFVGEVDGDGVELAVGGERAVGDQAVDVGVKVHEGAEGLDDQDATGGGFIAEQVAIGLEDGLPGETGELLEQVTVVAEEDAQAFGDGPDELAVRDAEADVVGDVETEQEGAFLGATGADAALLAGKGDEELVAAIGAADASEAVLEVAALEEVADGPVVDGPPVAELAGVAFNVNGAEVVEVFADEAVEVGFERLTWTVDADGLGDEAGQG